MQVVIATIQHKKLTIIYFTVAPKIRSLELIRAFDNNLRVEVIGYPKVEMRWLKNGQPLKVSVVEYGFMVLYYFSWKKHHAMC